ncbi:MAG: ankyrin repeat domain-containing protein, partial [Gammaproteobacteria bacterium]
MAVGRPAINLDKLSLGLHGTLSSAVLDHQKYLLLIEIFRRRLIANNLSKDEIANLLWVAIKLNHTQLLGAILSNGIDPNTQIPFQTDSIHLPLVVCAAKFNSLDVLRFLLEDKKANYSSANCQYTPLNTACANGNLNTVNYLLEQNRQQEPRAMITAVMQAQLKVINTLIDKGGYSVNTPNADGVMPITFAIGMGDIDVVSLLIDRGANLSPTYPIEHPMITFKSVQRDLEAGISLSADLNSSKLNRIEELLIKKGVRENTESFAPAVFGDVCSVQGNNPDIGGLTEFLVRHCDIIFKSGSLYDGCKILTPENRTKVLAVAIDHCPDRLIPRETSTSSQQYLSLLHICARFNETALAKQLINKGHVIDLICQEDQLTPLHMATVHNAKEMVFYLLELGINFNARTKQGDTALHFATSKPDTDIDIIKKMLAHPAFTFSSLDPFQRNIIHKAIISRRPDVLAAALSQLTFEECQSVLFAKDHEGKTPVMRAIDKGNISSIIQILSTLRAWGVIDIDSPLDKIEPLSDIETDLLLSVLYAHSNIDAIAHLAVRLLSTNKTNKSELRAKFAEEILTVMLNNDEFKLYIPHNLQAYSQALIAFFQQMTKIFADNKKTADVSAAILKYELPPLDVVMLDADNTDHEACARLFNVFNILLIKFRTDARNTIKFDHADKVKELSEQQCNAHHFSVILGSLLEKLIGRSESIHQQAWYQSWHKNLAEAYHIFVDINNSFLKELDKLRIGDELLDEEKVAAKKLPGIKKSSRKKNKKSNSNQKTLTALAILERSFSSIDSIDNEFSNEIAQLKAACMSEDIDEINRLLSIQDLPCQPDILIHCIDSKSNKSLKLLLDAGYSPNTCILGNVTPLFAAIASGNAEAMKMLFDAGVDVCPPFPNKQPLVQVKYKRHSLEQELEKGCLESAIFYKLQRDLAFYNSAEEELIVQGAKSNLNNFLPSYFKYLCETAVNVEDVLTFMQEYKADLGVLLEHTLQTGLISLATKELSVGVVFNAFIDLVPDNYIFKKQEIEAPLCFSLMHIAVLHNSILALQKLISRGHYVDFKAGIDGGTPLHLAVAHGTPEIRKYLISKGANVDALNSFSNTPLHTAIKNMNMSVVWELLSCKANVDIPNDNQDTPLHFASRYFIDIVKLMMLSVALRDEPTPLFSKNKENITPIQLVACNKDMKVLGSMVTLLKGQKYFSNDKSQYSVTQSEQELLLALLSIGVEIKDIPELALGQLSIVNKPMSGELIQRAINLAEDKLLQINLPANVKSYLEKLFKYFKLMSVGISSKKNLDGVVQQLLAVNLSIPDFVSLSWNISATGKMLCDKLFVFLINILLEHVYKVDVLFSDLQRSNVAIVQQQSLLKHLKSGIICMRRFLVASNSNSDTSELEFEKSWIEKVDAYNKMLDEHFGRINNKEKSYKAADALLIELSSPKNNSTTPKKSKAKKMTSTPKIQKATSSAAAIGTEKQRLKE